MLEVTLDGLWCIDSRSDTKRACSRKDSFRGDRHIRPKVSENVAFQVIRIVTISIVTICCVTSDTIGFAMQRVALILGTALLLTLGRAVCQEYSVKAVDVDTGKPLIGIPINLRYDCTYTWTDIQTRVHCKVIQRKTGADGLAHFPEAGSLHEIDDIFSLPIAYGPICCDISKPQIPGTGTIKFKRRSISEMMHWIFIGD